MRQITSFAIGIAAFALSLGVCAQKPPTRVDASQVGRAVPVAGRRHPERPPIATVLVLRPTAAALRSPSWSSRKLDEASEVIERRLRQIGIASPVVTVDRGANTLTHRIPDGKPVDDLAGMLIRPAVLEFRYIPQLETDWRTQPEIVNGRKTGFETMLGPDGRPIPPRTLAALFARPPAFSGADLEANCRAEQTPQETVLHFEFKAGRKAAFEASTRAHTGKTLAIFLDRRLTGAPKIHEAIPGAGVIEGGFTLEEAKRLAIQLNSGAIPVPLEVVRHPRED